MISSLWPFSICHMFICSEYFQDAARGLVLLSCTSYSVGLMISYSMWGPTAIMSQYLLAQCSHGPLHTTQQTCKPDHSVPRQLTALIDILSLPGTHICCQATSPLLHQPDSAWKTWKLENKRDNFSEQYTAIVTVFYVSKYHDSKKSLQIQGQTAQTWSPTHWMWGLTLAQLAAPLLNDLAAG